MPLVLAEAVKNSNFAVWPEITCGSIVPIEEGPGLE